jgi:arylsulfatase A-like enzyme
VSLAAQYRETLATLGIDRIEFYDIQRGLYDETMARVDHHFGRFVERLKAQGEWENTILIVTADHGHPAGSHTRFGRELFDPVPAETEGAFFDSYRTRVPLVIVAPGRLPAGVRIREAVSLVDLLPTVLDLAGLPPLERTQGRSLVPLMRGDPEWETRPVILEQLERDVRTDEFTGHIEMIDGRWGASLEIWPERGPGDPPVQPSRWEAKARFHVDGAPRLLLYDLWEDPFTRQNVNDRFPELVEKYTRLLEEQWQAHLAMAALYKTGGQVELSPEQLETLRALGYIR